MKVVGDLIQCSVRSCKRKILVERVMVGTNHTSEIIVTCWSCLSEKGKKKSIGWYGIKLGKELKKV